MARKKTLLSCANSTVHIGMCWTTDEIHRIEQLFGFWLLAHCAGAKRWQPSRIYEARRKHAPTHTANSSVCARTQKPTETEYTVYGRNVKRTLKTEFSLACVVVSVDSTTVCVYLALLLVRSMVNRFNRDTVQMTARTDKIFLKSRQTHTHTHTGQPHIHQHCAKIAIINGLSVMALVGPCQMRISRVLRLFVDKYVCSHFLLFEWFRANGFTVVIRFPLFLLGGRTVFKIAPIQVHTDPVRATFIIIEFCEHCTVSR